MDLVLFIAQSYMVLKIIFYYYLNKIEFKFEFLFYRLLKIMKALMI
jgi:hypothetical protein